MQLKHVVPWGRNLKEYREMGLFSDADKEKKILGCGDGPASVNSELTKAGVDIISIDPIYEFTQEQIQKRVQETSHVVADQLRDNKDNFVWKNIKDIESLIKLRLNAMDEFLIDYEDGKRSGRYQHQELPRLSFKEKKFDLAWSSHFLFLYSEHFDAEFHLNAIKEMLRVANEVRIFPLLDLNNARSTHLDAVLEYVAKKGYTYEILKSDYEFQRGANEVLKIWS